MTTEAREEYATTADAEPEYRSQDAHRHADAVVSAIDEDTAHIKRREVDEAITKLEATTELSDAQRDAIEAMADAIVGRLLAGPITRIQHATEWFTLRTTLRLFDVEFEPNGENRSDNPDQAVVNNDG
ncbi:MAG: hypothetical protein SVG88_07455 [Halobacteriales archaeon]|nr:hypothetical protein [Halobacteriales archaeon]